MKNTQSYVQALKRQKMTWQQVGDLIGISRALAWRVGHGLCDSHKARAYFGLPPKLVGVVPCRVCGEVHQTKTCTSGYVSGSRERWATDIPKDIKHKGAEYRRIMRQHHINTVEYLRQS